MAPELSRWFPGGMRLRIAMSVTAVLLLLILGQSLALLALYEEMEEDLIEDTLDRQLSYSIEQSRKIGTLSQPRTPQMALYRLEPGHTLPQDLSPQLANLPIGNHEDHSTGRELHVAVREVDGTRYVLLYDETMHLAREKVALTAVVMSGLVLITLAFSLVYAISKRLTRGLEALAARVGRNRDGGSLNLNGLDGEILAVARALDLSEERQAALLLRERTFNSNVSHELRTPLAAIRSDAEMLLDEPDLPAKTRRRLERIMQTTDRTTKLTQSLLMLARDASPQSIEPVNLADAVGEVWGRLQDTRGTTSGLSEHMTRDAVIDTDPTLFQVVLHNLLENAIHHGEGVAIEIRLEGSSLSVCDRGPGFGTNDPMRVFERFRRLGDKAGHGLGLALVQHICSASGWRATAANRAGGGACLTIDFGFHLRRVAQR